MNVLPIRNCSAYSEPMTSHAFGELAGSRRTQRAAQFWRHIKMISSIDAYLYLRNNPAKFHPDQIWNDDALGFFDGRFNKNNKTSSNYGVSSWSKKLRLCLRHAWCKQKIKQQKKKADEIQYPTNSSVICEDTQGVDGTRSLLHSTVICDKV